MAGIAVSALIVASSGWAGAQQARVIEVKQKPERVIELRSVQEANKARFAYAIAQDFEFPRELRLAASWRIRGGGLAGRVLANAEELALTEAQQQSIREMQRDLLTPEQLDQLDEMSPRALFQMYRR